MIDSGTRLSISRQCALLSVSRSTYHHRPSPQGTDDLAVMGLIDEIHLELPFYGKGHVVKNTDHYRDPSIRIADYEAKLCAMVGDEVGSQLCDLLRITSPGSTAINWVVR